MRILTYSTLFPNAGEPVKGIFVETRLRHLVAGGEGVEARVVAPIPWFPSAHPRFGAWARWAVASAREQRHGLPIWHPRYPVIPKFGMTMAPVLLYLWTRGLVRRLHAEANFDLIDAHYLYPDGVAAALLARDLGKPLVITGRGTDLTLIPRYPLARAQMRWAVARAAALVTVCRALTEPLRELGVPDDKIRVLRNGVDLVGFCPCDRGAARRALELPPPGQGAVLASVGLLIERKGHDRVIEALTRLPDTRLLVVGAGPERAALAAGAARAGVAERVRFLGEVPQSALAMIYSAADVLVLASSREGWPNVLLEAMACGTPVAASAVWGNVEVVTDPAAGVLFEQRTGSGVAEALAPLLATPPDRAATRAYAERFSWEATTRGQIDLFRQTP